MLSEGFRDGKVCVLGLGYVGLTLAVAMADAGFEVLGVEIRDEVLEDLRRGEPHFHEPGLQEKLRRALRERMRGGKRAALAGVDEGVSHAQAPNIFESL